VNLLNLGRIGRAPGCVNTREPRGFPSMDPS
jgi:hypothetical protein